MERPVNDIPAVVLVLCAIAAGWELWLSAGQYGLAGGPTGIGWRLAALQDHSVSPAVLDYLVLRGWNQPELLQRFVTAPFVHGSFTHALFAIALLLALGKFVGDALGNLATLSLFWVSTWAGMLVFCLVKAGTDPLFGLYPGVYGLIGGYTYLLWLRLGQMGQQQLQAFRLIGFLLGLQLVFGLLFGSNGQWIAELAAFVAGFAAAPVLAPGGLAALRARLRRG